MSQKQFSEDSIRPKDLMEKQRVMVLSDVGRMLSRYKEFVYVNCPACNYSESKKIFTKNGIDYIRCTECETLYVNPRPSVEVLDWFYRESENYAYWNKYIFPASEKARMENIFVPRVDKIIDFCEKYQIKMDSLLEVGAAFGTFSSEMKSRKKFKRLVAVEPTPDLAQTCREKGIEVIEKPIEYILFNETEKFDVIVNFEVIEHLFSPKEFILSCKKLLRKDGLLVTTCPNGKGFDFTVLGQLCTSVDHEHLNYFNPKSLAYLLESSGFEVLEVQTPGRLDAELVRNKIMSGEFDVTHQPFLKQVLVDNWETVGGSFQEFLSVSGLSSSMWIVAKNC